MVGMLLWLWNWVFKPMLGMALFFNGLAALIKFPSNWRTVDPMLSAIYTDPTRLITVVLSFAFLIWLYLPQIKLLRDSHQQEPKSKKPATYARQIDPKRMYIAPKPNMLMSEVLDYVTDLLVSSRTGNIDEEETLAAQAITEKIKEGKLKTWGKRVRIKNDFGFRRYNVNTDREEFDLEDWRHRELLPLEAGIPSAETPQTTSSGRDDDHTQFTDLQVNQEQIYKLWPTTDTETHDMRVLDAIYQAIEHKHGRPYERIPTPQRLNDIKAVCSEIRQFAGDENLEIWGSFSRDEFLKKIPSDYWENYQIALTSVLGGTNDPKEISTEPATVGMRMRVGMIYKGLKTTSSKVNELWPLANT